MDAKRLRLFQGLVSAVALVGAIDLVYSLVRLDETAAYVYAMFGAAVLDQATLPGLSAAPVVLYQIARSIALALLLALAWRAGHRPEARVLAVYLASLCYDDRWIQALGAAETGVHALRWLVAWAGVAALVRFTVLFPRPLTRDDLEEARRRRSLGRVGGALRAVGGALTAPFRWMGRAIAAPALRELHPVRRFRAQLLRPEAVWLPALGLAVVYAALGVDLYDANSPATALYSFAYYGAVVLGVGFLRSSVRVASAEGRRRLLWIVQGFYAAAWVVVLTIPVGFVLGAIVGFSAAHAGAAPPTAAAMLPYLPVLLGASILPLLIVIVSLAVAIFYEGALDPALAIRKTTVYGTLGLSFVALFAVVENAIADRLVEAAGLSDTVGGLLAAGVVALGMGPLRSALERWSAPKLARVAERGRPGEVAVVVSEPVDLAVSGPRPRQAALLFQEEARDAATRQGGRLVRTLGDRVLLEFASVGAALAAVGELEQQYRSGCALLGLPAPALRSGVHAGTVEHASGGAGDEAVRFAARLQASAAPGEVVVSQAAAEAVRLDGRFHLEPAGDPEPLARFRLAV